MHPQDKSGEEVRAFWHRPAPPRSSYEDEQAWILNELLEDYPALMTFDEARIARVRDRETGANRTPSKSPSAPSSPPA